ncbi:flagellar motor switch protein FliM [bacterium]|nr:flagellar motor switch protein FliM [bacterium]
MDENQLPDDNNIESSSSEKDFTNAEDIQDIFEQPIFDTEEKDSQSSDISEEFRRGYKLYNFRRPDKFSKEHLRALQDIHRDFARQLAMSLTPYLRMDVEMDIISVDQLTYDEFVCSMPPHIQNGTFKLNPLNGEISIGLSPEVLTAFLDRMLGGDGSNTEFNRELTSIEEALTKKIIERIVATLEEAWNSVIHVKAEFSSLDNGYHVVPIATSGEIVALISFEIRIGQKNFGLINICFPYPVLESVLPKLTPQYIYQHTSVISNEIGRSEVLNKINSVDLDLSVQLGTTNIMIDEVLDLKEGDIIKLDQNINQDLIVLINGKKKFTASPGLIENKLCIKIADRYTPAK